MMQQKLKMLYSKNERFVRYLVMATVIVGVELMTFQAIYLITNNLYLATVISFVTGVVLNWIGGRLLIFGISSRHTAHEFTMIFIASVVGLGIQLAVVSFSVQALGLYPLIGKILSILFSFFWNYWFRVKIVYRKDKDKNIFSSPSWPSIALFVVGSIVASIIFFIRFPNNFIEPNFYAEDGSIFLNNIHQHGFLSAVFTPFNGYFISGLYILEGLGYITNSIFFHGDFLDLAKSFAIISYVFLGTICALPLLLFRRQFGIYALAIIFLLSTFVPIPGFDYAIIGTISNLKFVFVYIAFLLLVYRHFIPDKNWVRFIIVDLALLICAYTNVVVYLLLPFALLRYVPQLRGKKFRQLFNDRSVQSLVGLGILLLPQVILIKLFGILPMPGYLDAPYRNEATVNLFIYRPYLFPILSSVDKSMSDILAILAFVASNVVLWFWLRQYRSIYIFGFLAIFLTTLLFVLHRTGVSELYLSYASGGPDQFFYTQNLIFCFIFGVAVALAIRSLRNEKFRVIMYGTLVTLILLFYIPRAGTYGKNDFMQRTVKNIYVNAQTACSTYADYPVIQLYPVHSSTFQIRDVNRSEICTNDTLNYLPDTEYLPMKDRPGPYIPDIEATPVAQTFYTEFNGLSGVSLEFLTYKQSVKDHYELTLYSENCSTKLRSVVINPDSIKDTEDTRINFPAIDNSKGKKYCVKISHTGPKSAPLALAVSKDNIYPQGQLTVSGAQKTTDLILQLHHTR